MKIKLDENHSNFSRSRSLSIDNGTNLLVLIFMSLNGGY